MSLYELGWNQYFAGLWEERVQPEWIPARVVSQQRGLWRVGGDFEESWAEAAGTLRAAAEAGGEWPAGGEWVATQIAAGGGGPQIQTGLRRRRKVTDKVAGRRNEEQVIAANDDSGSVVI